MKQLISEVFEGKQWSTDTVFRDTLKDVHHQNFTVSLLPTLSDLDTPEDLKQFPKFNNTER